MSAVRDKKENLKERNENLLEGEKCDKSPIIEIMGNIWKFVWGRNYLFLNVTFKCYPYINNLMWCNCVPFCLK